MVSVMEDFVVSQILTHYEHILQEITEKVDAINPNFAQDSNKDHGIFMKLNTSESGGKLENGYSVL